MKTTKPNSESFVRGRHRAALWMPLLDLVAAGLALTLALLWFAHPSLSPVADWRRMGIGWLAGLAVTSMGAVALWRARRRTMLRSAVEMDAVLPTANRLETATALLGAQDALAKAQRAETEQFLQQTRIVSRRRRLWVPVMLVTLLACAHLATLVCWARPGPGTANARKQPAVVTAEKSAPTAPTASIDWRSPESDTSATAIEEVPLEAEADSATGLRNAVLEIEVNGTPRLSQPLPDDLSKPGPHILKPSIYLDQLDVKAYDIVSYHLSAQRIAGVPMPPTVSSVQFVEIKPMRQDTFVSAGGDQPGKNFNYITALKAAQLQLMKDNFALAHPDASHDDSEWRDENSRVGGEQSQLAARTGEVIAVMTTNHYPEQILGLVRQSEPLMSDAGAKIARQENQPALQPQGQALADLTEVEKYLRNAVQLASSTSKQPNATDPFQSRKNLELKTHPLTRAGQIDALARAQSQLANDLAGGNTNATIKLASEDHPTNDIAGTPAERQAKIKVRIGDFLNDPGMTGDALKHLQSSDEFAGESQEQIDQSDFAAASEPAAEAARELQQTAAALRAGGNQAAKDKLADALLQLSTAAGDARRAPLAKSDAAAAAELKQTGDAVRQAAQQLAAEAQRQQENGATNAAARLEDLANMLQGEPLKQMLAQAQASPRDAAQTGALAQKLDELAGHAGQLRNPGPLSRQALAQLVEQLQRAQANLNYLASQYTSPGASPSGQPGKAGSSAGISSPGTGSVGAPSGPAQAGAAKMSRADMQRAEGAQLLDELRLDSMDASGAPSGMIYAAQLDKILRSAAEMPATDPDNFAPLAAEMDAPLTGLINSLQTELAGMRRQFELVSEETAPAPPAYRAAVADYFEQVSRDYQPVKDEPDDSH